MTKPASVDAYIASLPSKTQVVLQEARQIIRATIPQAEEVISYSIICFKVKKAYAVYLGGWQDHIALYPIPQGSAAFQKKIQPFRTGRGTLQFTLDKSLPKALIKEVVKELLART